MKPKMKPAGQYFWPGFGVLLALALLAACVPERPSLTRQEALNPIPNSGSTSSAGIPGSAEASVAVADQQFDGESVVVPRVVSPGPGWMAIHNEDNGAVGPVIGFAPLDSGVNLNVLVQVDAAQVTPVLYAMLHTDAGTLGTYEFPGPDAPVTVNGEMVTLPFKASGSEPLPPGITASDQAVHGGTVLVDQVVSAGPGWIAILAADTGGQPGEIIGYAHVVDGMNSGVVVNIDPARATPVLFASLYVDAGEMGAFENPSPDAAVVVAGQAVSLSFLSAPGAEPTLTPDSTAAATSAAAATPAADVDGTQSKPLVKTGTHTPESESDRATPHQTTTATFPMVKVYNQVLDSWEVSIEQVTSLEPGWLVVYSVRNGQTDQEVGYAAVPEGVSRDVKVKIDPHKTTGTLFALLHVDAGTPGTYENPGPDVAVVVGTKLIGTHFTIRLRDQVPTETVPPGKPKKSPSTATPQAPTNTPWVPTSTDPPPEPPPTDEPPPPPPPTDVPPPPPPPTDEPPPPSAESTP